MAFVAIGVLVLALVVSGNTRPGTIVVQRITMTSTTATAGKAHRLMAFSISTITETSANGTDERSLTSSSFARSGVETATAGDTIQLYDPADDTIYVTTQQAQLRAFIAELGRTGPKEVLRGVGVGKMQVISASSVGYAPGRTGSNGQFLRQDGYRLAGRTSIDGHAAIRFVQGSKPTVVAPGSNSGGSNAGSFESRTTMYVAPGSYAPIETVNTAKLGATMTTSVTRWQTYRVLRATPANQWLVSLTARHPQARVVDSAVAYIRASQSDALEAYGIRPRNS
jgi:hypothetical protein